LVLVYAVCAFLNEVRLYIDRGSSMYAVLGESSRGLAEFFQDLA